MGAFKLNIGQRLRPLLCDDLLCPAGFSLSIRRLKLLNVVLARPTQEAVPKLLPLGLFAAAPSKLSMMDVRLVVPTPVFDEFLTFFSRFLRPVREKQDGGVGMHTVRCCCGQAPAGECFFLHADVDASPAEKKPGALSLTPSLLCSPANCNCEFLAACVLHTSCVCCICGPNQHYPLHAGWSQLSQRAVLSRQLH